MQFREITHSDNIWEDIRNIFKENEHSLIFLTEDVHNIIINTGIKIPEHEIIYDYEISIDIPYVDFIKEPLKGIHQYPDIISFTHNTNNLNMVWYFRSSVFQYPHDHYTTRDDIESIVVIK